MCGYLTEFTFNNKQLTTKLHFEALLALSKHRGPDSNQVALKSYYQLGFNRLAILDLSSNGDQPKYSPTKRYHVVFNGEIYNYKLLEKEYKLKKLNSTSDTEVLVHLLDRLGVEETIQELNGMFAITIIDTKTHTLYCARDFAGIKPLFYGISSQGIVTASQFDQIFKHSWFKDDLQLRKDIMKEYFGFGYMQAPNTIYENIFQVNPGEFLKVSSHGELSSHVFKRFQKNDETTNNEEELVEIIKEELHVSVKNQLVSDVPLSTFLSGGIDSPLITAFAKVHNSDIEAFTVSVDDKAIDESESAKTYAKHLKIKHIVEKFNEDDLLNQIDNHFKLLPEPFGDYSSIPTYLITKKAKEKNTVMLSGDGGDELFFGYPRMLDVLKKYKWFKIPFAIRKPLLRLAIKLKLSDTWAPYNYKTLSEFIKEKHTHIFKDKLNEIFSGSDFSDELNSLYDFNKMKSQQGLLQFLRYNEFYAHLQRVLIKVDRMSMANSLEVRVPFLDKHIIETALKLQPKNFKTNADLKKTLKMIMEEYYPKNYFNNNKKGFSVPIEKWLKNQLHEDVINVIFNKPFFGAHLINVNAIQNYILEFYNNKHDSAWGVWHIYAWQKWAISKDLI